MVDNDDALENVEYSTSSPCKLSLNDISVSNHCSRGLQDLLEQAALDQKGIQEKKYVHSGNSKYKLQLL